MMSQEIPGLLSTLASKPFEIFQDANVKPIQGFLSNLVNITDLETEFGKMFKTKVLGIVDSGFAMLFNPLAKATEPEQAMKILRYCSGQAKSVWQLVED